MQSTVASDFANVNLRQSAAGGSVSNTSTLICQSVASCPTANAIKDAKHVEAFLNAPAAGTYQFGFTYNRIAPGTGAISPNIAAFRPLVLMVEDVGPSLGATSP
jgi:hypothetical protein